MLAGIGVDIVETERLERPLKRFGERFARKILTDREMDIYRHRGNRSTAFLATRFAAKEAASKALGTGMRDGIWFHSFELANDRQGKPQLVFLGAAERICQQRGISTAMVSISDERHYAMALVVLESA